MTEIFRFADAVPIPPPSAKKSRTSCQYCIVGCGYVVYVWPTDVPAGGVFEVGAGGYENQTVFFTQHVINYGARLIVQDPRKTMDAAYAQAHGGLHLSLKPGTDTVLLNTIARVIVENGWQDTEFINQFMVSSSTDIQAETNWRRQHFGMTFADYQHMLQNPLYELTNAAQFTGVPADRIQAAAQLIAKPNAQGQRPKTLFLFEKGLIWGINYQNVASIANLALLVGSIGQEGRGISRSGGHQEGFASPVAYPMQNATDTGLFGEKLPNYIDAHIEQGEVKVYHVIGANPAGMTNSSQHFRKILAGKLAQRPQVASSDTAAALATLIARMDSGGIVLIAQDIYPNLTTEMADLVLPAAAWGEMNGVRINGERRARLYEQFMDAPGQAMRDWWIIAQIAQRMGFSGFNWQTDEEVFTELAPYAQYDASAVVKYANLKKQSPYAILRGLPDGIQLPAQLVNGQLVGTVRLFADRKFGTTSGKAMFINSDWTGLPAQVYAQLHPQGDEFWVINGRVNELWQTLYTHKRIPFILERWPSNHAEINPTDATRLGVQSGDIIALASDRVYTQQAGVFDKGSFTAVAYVSDIVPQGVVFTNFAYPDQWMNSISPRWMHPANPIPPYKLARARLTRIGPSDLATRMSFAPRNIAG